MRHEFLGALIGVCTTQLGGCLPPPPSETLQGDAESKGANPDASYDSAADGTTALKDAAPIDSTRPVEGGAEGSLTADAYPDGLTEAEAGEAGPDAGACLVGGSCSPAPCELGAMSCDGGLLQCVHTTSASNGATCDAGAVCYGGVCQACNNGADCTEAGSCQKMSVACNTGTAVCAPAGTVADGTSCGTNLYCNQGSCAACTNGASCVPMGKPCNQGVVSCPQGQVVCTDQGTAASDGTSCGTNQVCRGGMCASCSANVQCTPSNDCHTGVTSCSTGTSVCTDTGTAQSDGTTCTGTNLCNRTYTCGAGNCAGSNPVSCVASDQCHLAGTCDPTTGTCSNPAASAGTSCGTNMVCDGMGNCSGCATGFTNCSGACVSLSAAANCGACGHDCGGGTCNSSSGVCTPFSFASSGPVTIVGLASDGNVVVWADTNNGGTGFIGQVSTPGGSATTLAQSNKPINIAYNSSTANVMWLNQQGGGGWQIGCAKLAPASGSSLTGLTLDSSAITTATILLSSGAFAAGGGSSGPAGLHVYTATCASATLTAGPSTTAGSNVAGISLAQTSSGFVFTDAAGAKAYASSGLSSSAAVTAFSDVHAYSLNPYTSDGTYVYDANNAGVFRLDLSALTATAVYSGSDVGSYIATDGHYVYYTTSGGIAYALASQTNGSASLIAGVSGSPANLIYASGALYYNVGSTIYKVVTPL